MKVAILTSFFFHEVKEIQGQDRIIFGGAERYLVELCRLLQSDGHSVTVFQSLPQTVRDEQGRQVRINSEAVSKNYAGIPVVCLPNTDNAWDFTSGNQPKPLQTNKKLNMEFNEFAIYYDLRIYFATFLCYGEVKLPAISINHGIFWEYPQNAFRDYMEEEKREFFKRQLYGITSPDICIAVDSNIRRVLQSIDPVCISRLHVIYNFADCEKFKPAPKTWEGTRVLYPRRLTMLRGCNEFIKASRELPEYEFIAVGQAADEGLEKQVVAWGESTPNIRFVYKPMEGMEEVYQQADISVVPTRASEGLSLSLLESMACGLPIVTTPVGGLGDAVIPNYNAIIYDPHHDNLSDAIRFLAENPDICQKMGERNRQIAEESFDIQLWKARWRSVLRMFG